LSTLPYAPPIGSILKRYVRVYLLRLEFTFHYRTISPSRGSQMLRLFCYWILLPHLFLISHFFKTVHEHSGI